MYTYQIIYGLYMGQLQVPVQRYDRDHSLCQLAKDYADKLDGALYEQLTGLVDIEIYNSKGEVVQVISLDIFEELD